MNHLRTAIATATFLFLTNFSYSQNPVPGLLNNADKNRLAYNFSQCLKIYKEVLTIEPNNIRALDAIIDIYLTDYAIYDSAEIYLNRRISFATPDTNYLIYYKYAECLRMQEKHLEALKYFEFYRKHMTKAQAKAGMVNTLNKSIDYSQNALKNKELIYEPYEVENMGFFINSVDAEYTPVFIADDSLLLYNARYKDYEAEHMSADNKYFENIYYFDLKESVASTYNEDIDQRTHQAVVSRSYDSDTLIEFYHNRVWLSSFGNDHLQELTE